MEQTIEKQTDSKDLKASKRMNCFSLFGSIKQSKVTRMLYVVIIFVVTLTGMFMISPVITGKFQSIFCRKFNYYFCDVLVGYDAVYRIGFALALWFVILTIATFGISSTGNKRAIIQNGCWPLKLFCLILLQVTFIFIPHTDYNGEIWIFFGLNGAFCYIILQYVFILDAAHWFNFFSDAITEKNNDFPTLAVSWFRMAKNLTTIFLYAVSILSSITFYFLYASTPECLDNLVFLVFHLVMCFAASVIAILPVVHEVRPQAGLFPCSVTSLYCTYLIWLAFSCEPDERCNPSDGHRYPGSPLANIQVFVTLLITFGTLVVICCRDLVSPQFGKEFREVKTSESKRNLKDTWEEDDISSITMNDSSEVKNPFAQPSQSTQNIETSNLSSFRPPDEDIDEEDHKQNSTIVFDDEVDGVEYSYSFFHVTFCLATIYLIMTITNWYRLDEGEHLNVRLIRSWSSVWLRVSAGIFCTFILIWSMVVPLLFPDSYNDLLYFQYMTSLSKPQI